ADEAVYAKLDATARTVGELASKALTEQGVVHQLAYAGNLFSIFFTAEPVANFEQAQATETYRYGPFFHSMLAAGVYLPPSAFESWFVTAAHDDTALSIIADALPAAARAAAAAEANPR
ncbi:MAG: aspartate aminotransferase family protein, partial [Jatrophihabitantaceae bacterium]